MEELKERLKLRKRNSEKSVKEYVISQRPEKFRCPKWDGENISTNIKCGYCGYVFREKDYYNDEVSTEKDECGENSNMVLYVISFLLPLVGIILGVIYIGKDENDLGKLLILFSIIIAIIGYVLALALI